MLNNKEKQKLRKIAHGQRALFQIGKDNISDNLIKTISDSLEAHELVKISLLKTASIAVREAAYDIAAATHSEIVMIIGRTMVLYRRSKKNLMEL
ncbi:MAG: YhbY family RNA-binding protein [Erysipelotrichaceae bacterium]|nr:YhbY family RNA-binding protein [Erysipelotrichaceae bacterium]